MKKFFVSFAKSTVLLLFFIIFSCNSCSDDDLFDTVRSTNEEVTAVIIDSTENSTTIQDVTDTSVIAESATNRDCKTAGGKANDIGLKSWCWENISLPSGEPDDNNFSDRQLVISSECNPGQVSKEGNRLRFYLNPTYPKPKNWCSNSYNMRAEFRTAPWKVNHPIGTEEWFGWSYTFGDDYIVDQETPWAFFQVHEGTRGKTPMIALWCTTKGGPGGGRAGEIIVSNTTGGGDTYASTGVLPQAGQTINMVVRVVWGDENNGLLQIWIDGNKVHDVQRRTVHSFNPVGGNAKFGIYKWPWRDEAGVQKSLKQGITELETFMGPLRMITRKLGDPNYGENSYNDVKPE